MVKNMFNFEIITNAVESGNIEKIGWLETGFFKFESGETLPRGVLEVQFKGGSRYRYKDVPITVWELFKNSESKGSFLAKEIKGKFECIKFTPEPENKSCV